MVELTGTAAPDVLPADALPAGTEAWDVIVVGFGIAGGCSALEADATGCWSLSFARQPSAPAPKTTPSDAAVATQCTPRHHVGVTGTLGP